jgi:hypothetical protein
MVQCTWGKKLKVPATARGKGVNSPCGTRLEVPAGAVAISSLGYIPWLIAFFKIDSSGTTGQAYNVLMIMRIYCVLGFVSGITLIVLGVLIYDYPLLCPLTGLILYLLPIGFLVLLHPLVLISPMTIVRALIIGALINAVNEGSYYHRD